MFKSVGQKKFYALVNNKCAWGQEKQLYIDRL